MEKHSYAAAQKNKVRFLGLIVLVSVFSLLFSMASGCAHCVLMRSEYYDMTGRSFEAKADDAPIEIFELGQKPERTFTEIGVVKVIAQPNMSREAVSEALKKRARQAGADALVDVQFKEDKENKAWFCGLFGSTRHNTGAVGRAVIFVGEMS